MGTVTHTCHDVVPVSLSSEGVRTLSGLQVCLGDTDTDSSINRLLSEAAFWDFSYQVTLLKNCEVLDGWA